MSRELVYDAKQYMEQLGLPVRQGYQNDIEKLKFGKANQLDGIIQARYQVASIQDVVNSEDSINAYYTNPFIFISSELQVILTNQYHPRHHYGLTIMVHECVHYLQPFEVDTTQSSEGLVLNQILQIPYEYDAYLVMALYFFKIKNIPNSKADKNQIIKRFLNDPY